MSRNSGTWGSISRVFSRASKQRKTLDLSIYEGNMVHFSIIAISKKINYIKDLHY